MMEPKGPRDPGEPTTGLRPSSWPLPISSTPLQGSSTRLSTAFPPVSTASLVLPALLFAALAAALRFPTLALKPYWIAEVQEFTYAWRDDTLRFLPFAAGDIIGFAWQECCATLGLPPDPFVVRGLSAITGSLLPAALYVLLARRGLRQEGTVAALLTALSLPLLAASQEARYYIGMSTFLGMGILIDAFPLPGRRSHRPSGPESSAPAPLLGLVDSLALLCHPYALFWIAVRWAGHFPVRPPAIRKDSLAPGGPTVRRWLRYGVPVTLAATAQVVQIAAAAGRFRNLHSWFRLEEYPPGFQLVPELLASVAGGTGWPLYLLAALAGIGLFLLSSERPRAALTLLLASFGGPVLVTAAIWLAGARYSFTHMLPATVPICVAAAFGIAQLARLAASRVPRSTFRVPALALALLLAAQPAMTVGRYLARSTRLELGADIASACRFLGSEARPGDVVATRYDKYFTAFVHYCGPQLADGVVVAVPEIPQDPFFIDFNHLFPAGSPPAAVDRTVLLESALPAASPDAAVFVVLPYFEDIEGKYNEWHGWLDGVGAYGPRVGPFPSASIHALTRWDYGLMRILRIPLRVGPDGRTWRPDQAPASELETWIRSVFAQGRPLR